MGTKLVSFVTRSGKRVQFYTSHRRRKSKQQSGGFMKSFFNARRRALPSRVSGAMKVMAGKMPWDNLGL